MVVDMELLLKLADEYGVKIVKREDVTEEEWNRISEQNKKLVEEMFDELKQNVSR